VKGRPAALLFASLCILSGLPGTAREAAPRPEAAVETVQVVRSPNGPRAVRFDGAADFTQGTAYFEGSMPAAPSARLYDIVLDFGSYQIPMRLISGQRAGQSLRFSVTAPEYVQCERPTVDLIGTRAPSGTIDQRVDLLVRARRLIALCDNPAYASYVQPKLVLKYYEVSCALATEGSSFAIHKDAQDLIRRIQRTEAVNRALADCSGRGTGRVVNGQWSLALTALDQGQHAAAASAAEDLLAKIDDPNWQDGFAAQKLNGDRLRELKVMALVGEQNAAARAAPDHAAEINDTLLGLRDDKDFAATMDKVGVTGKRLDADRAYIKGLQAAGPQF